MAGKRFLNFLFLLSIILPCIAYADAFDGVFFGVAGGPSSIEFKGQGNITVAIPAFALRFTQVDQATEGDVGASGSLSIGYGKAIHRGFIGIEFVASITSARVKTTDISGGPGGETGQITFVRISNNYGGHLLPGFFLSKGTLFIRIFFN